MQNGNQKIHPQAHAQASRAQSQQLHRQMQGQINFARDIVRLRQSNGLQQNPYIGLTQLPVPGAGTNFQTNNQNPNVQNPQAQVSHNIQGLNFQNAHIQNPLAQVSSNHFPGIRNPVAKIPKTATASPSQAARPGPSPTYS